MWELCDNIQGQGVPESKQAFDNWLWWWFSKIIFINLFPTLRLDLPVCIDFMHGVCGCCLTPASLVKGSRGSCTILLSSVNYSLHFSRRWISGWRSLLSPFSPHCALPACLFPPLLPPFIFLSSLLQKCQPLHLCIPRNASQDQGNSLRWTGKIKFSLRNLPILNGNECDVQELAASWQAVKTKHTRIFAHMAAKLFLKYLIWELEI